MSSQPPIPDAVEIIPKKLYWVSLDSAPKRVPENVHVFTTDRDLVYEPFSADFGPLNLGMVYRYCKTLSAKLNDPSLSEHMLIHYCSRDFTKRANSAFLVAAYLVIERNQTPSEAWRRFSAIHPNLTPYRDASAGPCSFQLTLLDCLSGLEKAINLGWFSMQSFDLASFEFHEKLENGDLTWIVPKKFTAFAGPSPTSIDVEGYPASTPEDFISYFRSSNIKTVVRLNKPLYDARRFSDQGITVHDLFFVDGSCPPRSVIDNFLTLAEAESGPIAIHCKAGLGRTGTLIGLYCMKHFAFPARAFIGWNRICRPGSILGPQQQFLCDIEPLMLQLGYPGNGKYRAELPLRVEVQAVTGSAAEDVGQGERLNKAKQSRASFGSDSTSAGSLFNKLIWN